MLLAQKLLSGPEIGLKTQLHIFVENLFQEPKTLLIPETNVLF